MPGGTIEGARYDEPICGSGAANGTQRMDPRLFRWMATLKAILQIEFGRVPGHSHPSFGVRRCLCAAPVVYLIGLFCGSAGIYACPALAPCRISGRHHGLAGYPDAIPVVA